MAPSQYDLRRTVAGYAALVRVPNLFTSPPDVVLGAALAAAAGARASPTVVAATAAASTLFYAGGTALNDYFDADRDAVERPERPIPSGRVPRRTALALGLASLAAGVAAVAVVAPGAAGVAILLALAVLLYDGALKGSSVGFLAMGVARGLNVTLGVVAVAGVGGVPLRTYAVPALVTGYVTAVTYMAAEEASGADRRAVGVGIAGAGLAALAVPVVHLFADAAAARLAAGLALAAGFALWTGRSLRRAYADPAPDTVGPAVGTCVLALVVLDAALAAVAGPGWAALALAFLGPAVGLARAFDVS